MISIRKRACWQPLTYFMALTLLCRIVWHVCSSANFLFKIDFVTERMSTTDICSFDYPGPLKYESLNCFQEFLPFASALSFPSYANNSYTLRGLE